MPIKRKKLNRKTRPVNEMTEQDVEDFLKAIKSIKGYPRVRDLCKLLPHVSPFKINVILRYLERSGTIFVDSESYITWIRKDGPEQLTLADVAIIKGNPRKFLEVEDGKEY